MSYNATGNSASRRIATLLDEGSFVEIGGAVTARSTTFNLQEKAAPSDGVITGYGVIDGNLVYVYSQDADVLGGALGEMHAKKIARIYDMAMKMGAPVIGLVDCAGMRLQEATAIISATFFVVPLALKNATNFLLIIKSPFLYVFFTKK